jgi:hypothetical protein
MTRRRKSLFTSSANFPLHTLLFGVYPVLSLLAANIQESPLDLGWRALLLSALLAAALLGLAWLWLRDWSRAGLVASVALAALLIYGQLYNALKLIPGGELVARHRFLAPVWLLAAGAAIWWLATRLRKATEATRVLNVIALLLIVFPAFTIASFAVRNSQAEQAAVELPADMPAQNLANAPDGRRLLARRSDAILLRLRQHAVHLGLAPAQLLRGRMQPVELPEDAALADLFAEHELSGGPRHNCQRTGR